MDYESDNEQFKRSISLQVAARAAKLAQGSPAIGAESEDSTPGSVRASRGLSNLEEDVSLRRSFRHSVNLVVVFATGVAVCASAVYFFLDVKLRVPPSSISVTMVTPSSAKQAMPPLPMPLPSATEAELLPPPPTAAPPPSPIAVVQAATPQPSPVVAAPVVPAAPMSTVPTPTQSERSPSEILEVQTRLEALGMKPGAPDGILGPQTIGAIKRYEEVNGRPLTGSIDSEILGQLRQEKPLSRAEAEGRPKPAAAVRQQAEQAEAALNLSEQARKQVQLALTALGHEVHATGNFGPITRGMIAEWQKKQGLLPSGFLNSSQFAALQQQAAPAFAK